MRPLRDAAVLKLNPVHHAPPAARSDLELAETLFALSRRIDQPFSVVWLEIGHGIEGLPDIDLVEHQIAAQLRRTDVLVRFGARGRITRYAVFCPATNAPGSKEIVRRVWSLVTPGPLLGGAATFPFDALVLDDLIDLAVVDARGSDVTGPPPDRANTTVIQIARTSRLTRGLDRRAAVLTKRAFDLLFSLLTAPIWLPVLALVAIAIKSTDPLAPVMFPQMRTGRGGSRFRMYKFRTMVRNAEDLKQTYAHLNQLAWPDFKIENDPRITRLGRILRKTSLDELPQVLNVLRGEMSWVGPRPTSFSADTYAPWQTARLDVVPGVTGWWQVIGRGRTEFDERLRLDMAYIDQRSLWFDLRILFLTVREVFNSRGGY
jgi:lipopolysaccharide/colanic/teichoic acid biosynthesis glycosyltransferase